MNLSNRDRRTLRIGGIALALLLVGHYVIMPTLADWREAREQIALARAQWPDVQVQTVTVTRQHDQLATLVGPGANKPLGTQARNVAEFGTKVEAVMRSAGVTVQRIRPQSPRTLREVPGVSVVSVQVTTRCKFSDLAKWLAKIQEADQLMLVEQLTSTAVEGKAGELDVTMVLTTLARTQGGK